MNPSKYNFLCRNVGDVRTDHHEVGLKVKTLLDYTPHSDTGSEMDDIAMGNASNALSKQEELGMKKSDIISTVVKGEVNQDCVQLKHPNSGLESQSSLDLKNVSQVCGILKAILENYVLCFCNYLSVVYHFYLRHHFWLFRLKVM